MGSSWARLYFVFAEKAEQKTGAKTKSPVH
jgi:hypothetical protein